MLNNCSIIQKKIVKEKGKPIDEAADEGKLLYSQVSRIELSQIKQFWGFLRWTRDTTLYLVLINFIIKLLFQYQNQGRAKQMDVLSVHMKKQLHFRDPSA